MTWEPGSSGPCVAPGTPATARMCEIMHICFHVGMLSMCTRSDYSGEDRRKKTLVARGTRRSLRRPVCKILRFVCLRCLGTIKTWGQAIGTALFTCRGCDSTEMKQSTSGGKMFPHAAPHRSRARIRPATVGRGRLRPAEEGRRIPS